MSTNDPAPISELAMLTNEVRALLKEKDLSRYGSMVHDVHPSEVELFLELVGPENFKITNRFVGHLKLTAEDFHLNSWYFGLYNENWVGLSDDRVRQWTDAYYLVLLLNNKPLDQFILHVPPSRFHNACKWAISLFPKTMQTIRSPDPRKKIEHLYKGSLLERYFDARVRINIQYPLNHTAVNITHGPPLNILDVDPAFTQHVGCPHIARRVNHSDNIIVHIFGHIHGCNGEVYQTKHNGQVCRYINATQCDSVNNITGVPRRFELVARD
jgi:hypothetical protein